jgi:hypothetical protein
MPQKINPDVLELTRGRTGRVIGNLQSLLVLVKGLPLAYNRDLQEDKEALFDSFDTVDGCLELAAPLVEGATLQREAIAARLEQGYLDSTTFMEYLIQRGVPQRTAHHLSGALVAEAMKRGATLAELPLDVFQQSHPDLDEDVYRILGANRRWRPFRAMVRRRLRRSRGSCSSGGAGFVPQGIPIHDRMHHRKTVPHTPGNQLAFDSRPPADRSLGLLEWRGLEVGTLLGVGRHAARNAPHDACTRRRSFRL